MLDEKDLQAIQAMLKPIQDNLRDLNLEMENTVKPQLQALAEGQKTILETLAPKSRVEALEEEVEFLKSIIKMHTSQINELKKAQ